MKLQDFKKVEDILVKLRVLNKASDKILKNCQEGSDNYGCYISEYSDGSGGSSVDLRGAYIYDKVLKATHDVIEDEIVLLEKELIELGVEL